MGFSRATWVLGVAALLAGSPVLGQQRQITTTVAPLSTDVTYSTATETYVVGYTVTIANSGNNTVNNVRFVGTTSVTLNGTATGLIAGFKGAEGITCDPVSSADRENQITTVTCQLGTFAAGPGSSKTFALFFYSPINISDAIKRNVVFDTYTYYAEGTTDNPNNPPQNDTFNQVVSNVTLGTPSAVEVKTALTPEGGTYYTGDQAITRPTDEFALRTTVPGQQQKYSSVTLLEIPQGGADATCSSLRNFHRCYAAEFTVPDVVFSSASGNFLTFVLRVDSANIRKGTKIDRVVIRYSADAVPPSEAFPNGIPAIYVPNVQFCAKDASGNPIPNANFEPCIAQAVRYARRTPGWTVDLDGDFEWTLLNLKNGRFDLF